MANKKWYSGMGGGVRHMQVKEAEALYHKYFAAVYSVCFLYMKNEADACDMVQETFLQLLQGRFTYQNQEKTKAWLIVTASNCCKKQLRKSWRKKIAKMLHVNASTVRSRLAKARELLRLELVPEENLQKNIGKVW